MVGGNCEAWLTNNKRPFGVDLFGSICFAYQHGKFRKDYGDLTRVDARLDVPSVSSISPKLNLILQQQVHLSRQYFI